MPYRLLNWLTFKRNQDRTFYYLLSMAFDVSACLARNGM